MKQEEFDYLIDTFDFDENGDFDEEDPEMIKIFKTFDEIIKEYGGDTYGK